jgi:hypothetical protein
MECGVVGDHKSKCAYGKFKNLSEELSQLNGLSPLAGEEPQISIMSPFLYPRVRERKMYLKLQTTSVQYA